MDKMTGARLDVIEATLEAIIKRQGIMAIMMAAPNSSPSFKMGKVEEMSKVLDEWTLKIKDIEEKFKNGNQDRKSC